MEQCACLDEEVRTQPPMYKRNKMRLPVPHTTRPGEADQDRRPEKTKGAEGMLSQSFSMKPEIELFFFEEISLKNKGLIILLV
jgi:hypothetical protein